VRGCWSISKGSDADRRSLPNFPTNEKPPVIWT
jgi:hypothetical protein